MSFSRICFALAGIVSALLLAAFPFTPASAGNTAIATITATAIRPLSVERKRPLIFGYIRPGRNGGTVSVHPRSGKRTVNGDVRSQQARDHTRAMFHVRGDKDRFYHVHLPSSVKAVRAGAPGYPDLDVTNLSAFSVTRNAEGVIGLLDKNGKDTLYVGGDLVVPPGAADGMYKATFEVTVTYQ